LTLWEACNEKYVILDTETTGLLDDAGDEIESWHSLFSVNFRLPEEIIRITGIKDAARARQ